MYQHDIIKYLNFRDAELSDIDRILEIEGQTYQFPWTRQIFQDCFKNRYHCFGIELHEELIGYAITSTVLDEAHLLNICIDLKHREQGIGKAAMEWLLDYFAKRRMLTMYLEVRPSNRTAYHLYRSLGFDEIGIRKAYYPAENGREDALVLSKNLAN